MGFFGAEKPLVGLDIGTHFLKACRVKPGRGKPKLLDFGVSRLPRRQAYLEEKEDRDYLARQIRSLFQNLRITSKEVAVASSDLPLFIEHISLRYAGEKDFAKAVQQEAEERLSVDMSELITDAQLIGPPRKKGDRAEVLFVAAKAVHVQALLDLAAKAGISAKVVDSGALALQNAYEATESDSVTPVLLVDLGAEHPHINVIHQGKSLHVCEISPGGAVIDQGIKECLQVDDPEAERIKLGKSVSPDVLESVGGIVADVVNQWLEEIRRVTDLIERNHDGMRVRRICLAGGGARIVGLADHLRDRLGVGVRIFNPFSGMETPASKFDSDYLAEVGALAGVSVGLALRKRGDQ
jgi:type IV pilus assembly protein PilM